MKDYEMVIQYTDNEKERNYILKSHSRAAIAYEMIEAIFEVTYSGSNKRFIVNDIVEKYKETIIAIMETINDELKSCKEIKR